MSNDSRREMFRQLVHTQLQAGGAFTEGQEARGWGQSATSILVG